MRASSRMPGVNGIAFTLPTGTSSALNGPSTQIGYSFASSPPARAGW